RPVWCSELTAPSSSRTNKKTPRRPNDPARAFVFAAAREEQDEENPGAHHAAAARRRSAAAGLSKRQRGRARHLRCDDTSQGQREAPAMMMIPDQLRRFWGWV